MSAPTTDSGAADEAMVEGVFERSKARGKRVTYNVILVLGEFNRLTELQHGEQPDLVIMPIDISSATGVPDATVRRILREQGVWTQEHRDAAKRETLRRINLSKREHGFPSLRKQANGGWKNLQKGRDTLARIRAAGHEALAATAQEN